MEVREVATGLWGWTARHPGWKPSAAWDEEVWCWYVELDGATVLVDPLVPGADAEQFWRHLDADVERRALPVQVLLTARQHRRSADEIAERYGGFVFDLGDQLPAGVGTFEIEHPQRVERPLWFPSHGALAFGDALAIRGGELRVWWDTRWPEREGWYRDRLLPSLEPLAELPVEHVLVAHGAHVGGGLDALAAALERPPYEQE